MRKRGARRESEHSSGEKLWSFLALSVVSVGFTTGAACRAHVAAPVQPLQSNEPVGDLLRPDGTYPIGRPSPPSPDEFPPRPSTPSIGPESTAADIKQAIVDCNIAKLRQTILNYGELVALIASRSPVEAEYKALVDDWIAVTTRQFCFTGKRGRTSELGEPETGNFVAGLVTLLKFLVLTCV